MAELRTDWLSGRSVIVAENRALRPNEFAMGLAATGGARTIADLARAEADSPNLRRVSNCPFCVGNESKTPPAVYEKSDTEGRWQVRVVPNRYPAVTPGDCPLFMPSDETTRTRDEHEREPADIESAPAYGAHEVIVESNRHVDRTTALSTDALCHVLDAYAHRLRHWCHESRFNFGLVFKNQGPRAGASMAHLHSQFVALRRVPPAVRAELSRARLDYRQRRDCPYCRLIEQERSFGERIVSDGDGYVAFCPFASLQPHELWLLPSVHEPSFEHMASPDATARLAEVLHSLLRRLELIVPDAAYNLLLRTAPWRDDCDPWWHWRIELLPRVNPMAGFEIATGVQINPLAPEAAARQLRST